jgi:hypothetical protein
MKPLTNTRWAALLQAAFVVLGTFIGLSCAMWRVVLDGAFPIAWSLPLCAFYFVALAGSVAALWRRPSVVLEAFAAAGALVCWAVVASTLGMILTTTAMVALGRAAESVTRAVQVPSIWGWLWAALASLIAWLAGAAVFVAGAVVAGRLLIGRWRP